MFYSRLNPYFSKYNTHFSRSLLNFCESMFLSGSSNTWEISRHMAAHQQLNFKAAEMRQYRLLSNPNFRVDDSLFRCHINLLFDSLVNDQFIKTGDQLLIAVDFTTKCDKFLICAASLIIGEQAYPLYFSLRNYPKKKGRYNHKKMESAFMQGLNHLLSKKYSYTIVADRGFGYLRFIQLCEENGFNYLLRVTPNMNGDYEEYMNSVRNLLNTPGKKRIHVKNWKKSLDFYRVESTKNTWFLVSDLPNMDHSACAALYKKRFKIEKIFQNLKSSGLEIERSKIQCYSKFKRLLFCCFLSYNIMILLGKYINEKMKNLKKNSSICENLILAYLTSQQKPSRIFIEQ